MSAAWWATKVRQTRDHLWARVAPDERGGLEAWLTPAQLAVFDSMTVADRRHGLDVVEALRGQGVEDRELLIAGLLHDAGKGAIGLGPRIVRSLGQAYGPWVWRVAGSVPGYRQALEVLADHPRRSARLAAAAGCTARTVELIRRQEDPVDAAGRLLHRADEAS